MIEYGYKSSRRYPENQFRTDENKFLNAFHLSPLNNDQLETQFILHGTKNGGSVSNPDFNSKKSEELINCRAIYFKGTGILIRGGTEEQLKQNPLPIDFSLISINTKDLITAGIEVRYLNDQNKLLSHQKPEK